MLCSLRLRIPPTVDHIFSHYSCTCVTKPFGTSSATIGRAFSFYANNYGTCITKLNNRRVHHWSKCGNIEFGVDISGVSQRRYFSSELAPEVVSRPPMVLKFLSESSPVLFAQESLVCLHDVTGLPWWATIVSCTIVLRTAVTLPLAVYQSRVLARYENILQEMPDIVKQLKTETAFAVKKFKWTEKEARIVYNRSLRKQKKKLIIRDNCHPAKASLLMCIQIPMWICLSASLRNLVYMLPQHSMLR